MEQQQQSLFDASIIKLQHEQLRHNRVEPRLLRFVLINNALRALQGHMLHVEDEDNLVGMADGFLSDSSDVFFYNTFKDGSLSPLPVSPPAPVKIMKLDGNGFGDQSPLIECQEAPASSPRPSQDMVTSMDDGSRIHPAACYDDSNGECEEGGGVEGGGGEGGASGGKDRRAQNGLNEVYMSGVYLGKRSREKSFDEPSHHPRDILRCRLPERNGLGVGAEIEDLGCGETKRSCKPSGLVTNSTVPKVHNLSNLNGLTSLYNINLDLDPLPPLPLPSSPPPLTLHYHNNNNHNSSSEESDKESLTPSPIDFTKVDLTLYNFDADPLPVDTADVSGSTTTSVLSSQQQTQTPFPSPITMNHPASPPSSPSCSPLAVASPQPLLSSSPSLPCSPHQTTPGLADMSSDLLGDCPHDKVDLDASSTCTIPHLEAEKRSLLSADSTVLTTIAGGSQPGKGTSSSSCSMQAIVRTQNSELELNGDGSHDRGSISNGRVLPTSPELGVESDYLDDIDHIVKLLMT